MLKTFGEHTQVGEFVISGYQLEFTDKDGYFLEVDLPPVKTESSDLDLIWVADKSASMHSNNGDFIDTQNYIMNCINGESKVKSMN